jgi:hypothetical protein
MADNVLAIFQSLPEEPGKCNDWVFPKMVVLHGPRPQVSTLKWSSDLDDLGFDVQPSTLVIWLDLDPMVGHTYTLIY